MAGPPTLVQNLAYAAVAPHQTTDVRCLARWPYTEILLHETINCFLAIHISTSQLRDIAIRQKLRSTLVQFIANLSWSNTKFR